MRFSWNETCEMHNALGVHFNLPNAGRYVKHQNKFLISVAKADLGEVLNFMLKQGYELVLIKRIEGEGVYDANGEVYELEEAFAIKLIGEKDET